MAHESYDPQTWIGKLGLRVKKGTASVTSAALVVKTLIALPAMAQAPPPHPGVYGIVSTMVGMGRSVDPSAAESPDPDALARTFGAGRSEAIARSGLRGVVLTDFGIIRSKDPNDPMSGNGSGVILQWKATPGHPARFDARLSMTDALWANSLTYDQLGAIAGHAGVRDRFPRIMDGPAFTIPSSVPHANGFYTFDIGGSDGKRYAYARIGRMGTVETLDVTVEGSER